MQFYEQQLRSSAAAKSLPSQRLTVLQITLVMAVSQTALLLILLHKSRRKQMSPVVIDKELGCV